MKLNSLGQLVRARLRNPEERARIGFVPGVGDTLCARRENPACWLGGAPSMTRCTPLYARVPRSEKPDHGPVLPAPSGVCHPVCHALIGGEYGFGFGPCQPGNYNLFANVERAQVVFD